MYAENKFISRLVVVQVPKYYDDGSFVNRNDIQEDLLLLVRLLCGLVVAFIVERSLFESGI